MIQKLIKISQIFYSSIKSDDWNSINSCDVLLICHDNNRGHNYQNQAYAHLLDSMGDLLRQKNLRIITVAKPFSQLTGQLGYGNPLSFNQSFLWIALQSRLINIFQGQKKRLSWVKEKRKKLWLKILSIACPKVIIVIQPSSSLCQACHSLSIPVYDLQHGIITDQHSWYGQKYRKNTSPIDLPSGFLCWDGSSAKALKKWTTSKRISVDIIGNPWFQRFLVNDYQDFLVKETINKNLFLQNKKPTIIITLQWGMKKHFGQYVPNGVMPYALERTILKLGENYNWLIRLHPVQIRGSEFSTIEKYLAKTFGHIKTVEWEKSSEFPLPIILNLSDLHITYNSSTTIEAAWMNVSTGLLDPEIRPDGNRSQYYSHERNLKIAETVPLNDMDIENWIKLKLGNSKVNSIFTNYQLNLDDFINKIVMTVNNQSGYR
ncbi:hypothetical protein [Picosynechococcus sp. PCC 7117]|uniref:hypothetical protein n=1 Tax=Picosynechococcus sp. PCC 7117 TaxID=195498 RepID=UPI0008108198|nr:hypothetical protein [Picosynechococcus sp. PCC 7117]ANV86369.1 hypothetical protein AWQ22_02125 [Picosynechococcus sp. PCC 7117]